MTTDTQTAPDVEHAARNLGWVPKEEWRGDEAKWVPADTFVKRGEEIMPLLKKNNQELQTKFDGAQAEIRRLNDAFKASQEAIEQLKEFQTTETKRQVADARKNLIAELKAAKKEGNTDLEVDLEQEIADLDRAADVVPAPKKAESSPSAPPPAAADPVFVAWRQENSWFDTDPVRQSTAIGIASKLRADPANVILTGRAFFDKVSAEVSAIFDKTPRGAPKVESSGGGAGPSDGGSGRAKTFSDLPPDAKAVCERQAAKLVGPGRAFKDDAAWKAHYAKIYFSEE